MKTLVHALLVATALLCCGAQASIVRGTGTAALIGHDLTDPENNGHPGQYLNYNAIFRANTNAGFASSGAYNVFDNVLGPNTGDKWCCTLAAPSSWVEADFGATRFYLNRFTVSSANDAPGRDADRWKILGSNDGLNYTTIFSYDRPGVSPWAARLQVNQYDVDRDFATPLAYSIFRYEASSAVTSGHQLGELEFFGSTTLPEPGLLALFGLGLAGLGFSRRKTRA